MLNRLLLVSPFLLPPLALAAGPQTLRGQIVCSGCWTEADRAKVVYGTEADHACARTCAKDGLPAALAVHEGETGQFTIHRIAATAELEGERRMAWIGKAVEVRADLEQDSKGSMLHLHSLNEIPWDRIGLPTGPPPAHKAAAAKEPPGELILADLDGFPQRLASLKGRVVVLNFWATWCLPCREEMPVLSRVQHRFAVRGVQVIGASADAPDQQRQVARFADRLAIAFPVWTGASTEAMASFGLPPMLPGTVVLDREGKVVEAFPGVVTEKQVADAVERALAIGVERTGLRASKRASRVPS